MSFVDFPPQLPAAFDGMTYGDLYNELRSSAQYHQIVDGIVFKKHKRNRPAIAVLNLDPALERSLIALGATTKTLTTLRRIYAHQRAVIEVDSGASSAEHQRAVIEVDSGASSAEEDDDSESSDDDVSSVASSSSQEVQSLSDDSASSSSSFSASSSSSCMEERISAAPSASASSSSNSQAPVVSLDLFASLLSETNLESFNRSVLQKYTLSKNGTGPAFLSAATVKSGYSNLISLIRKVAGGVNLSLFTGDHAHLRIPAQRCIEQLQDLSSAWKKCALRDTAAEGVRMRIVNDHLENPLLTLRRVYFYCFVEAYWFYAQFGGTQAESKGGRPVQDATKILRREQELKARVGGFIRLTAVLGRPLTRANALDTLTLQDSTVSNVVRDTIYVANHKTISSFGPLQIRFPPWAKSILNIYLRAGSQKRSRGVARPFPREFLLMGVARTPINVHVDTHEAAELLRAIKLSGLPKPRQELDMLLKVVPHDLLLLPSMSRYMRTLLSSTETTRALTVGAIRELVTSAADQIPSAGSKWSVHRQAIRESAAHCLRTESKTVENYYAPGLLNRREESLQRWIQAEIVDHAMQWVVQTICGQDVNLQGEQEAPSAESVVSTQMAAVVDVDPETPSLAASPAAATSRVTVAAFDAGPRPRTPTQAPTPAKRIKLDTEDQHSAPVPPTVTLPAQEEMKSTGQNDAAGRGGICGHCQKRVVYFLPNGKPASKCEVCASVARKCAADRRARIKLDALAKAQSPAS